MCGIAAIYSKKQKVDRKKILGLLDPISHRGEKQYFGELGNFNHCSIGMNRLAIVGRENGKQPISSNNNRYHIVLNGEIYNHKEIAIELHQQGYKFNTDSDTEVLVNAFDFFGEKVLEKIEGMFAFIIYDELENKIFAARDRIGIKPLYYANLEDGSIIFGSEIKSLSHSQEVSEIKLFPPAHYMQDGKLVQYWEMDLGIQFQNKEECVTKIRELFDEAVKKRVDTDLPIAVYLSGGIDSTAVLATARKFHDDITAIIVGNTESEDRKIATKYCKENNIPFIIHEPPSEEKIFEEVGKVIEVCESFEPNLVRQSSLSRHIAQAAKDFKVILCGEGADEIFCGYPEFATLKTNEDIQNKIKSFLSDLHRTQLQRVDRTSMEFTTEVRVPFLDTKFLEFVLKIYPTLKVFDRSPEKIAKYILRQAMSDRLPGYIFDRKKAVLSEGAGYKGNQKGGLFEELAEQKISDKEYEEISQKNISWKINSKEEAFYFSIFQKLNYDKALFARERVTANAKASMDTENIVFDSFNTWHFKSEHPHNKDLMKKKIAEHQTKNQPIEFVMYWGKGDRNSIGEPEKAAKRFLEKMLSGISDVYEHGWKVNLILTDTHVQLNDYTKEGMNHYYDELSDLLSDTNYTKYHLSEICEGLLDAYHVGDFPETIDGDAKDLLLQGAERHSKNKNTKKAAQNYYWISQVEIGQVAKQFSECIFLTYNSSKYNDVLPTELPIFYMYSSKKGFNEKPWFS